MNKLRKSTVDRKAKLQVLCTQLNKSLELISEIKCISVSYQKYKQAATEREVEKFLEQSLKQVEELLEL